MLEYICVWIVFELSFALYLHRWAKLLSQLPSRDYSENSEIIFRILDQISTFQSYTVQQFFEGFFLGAPFITIYRDNVISFLSWVIFNRSIENSSRADKVKISDIVNRIEIRYNLQFGVGYNPYISHVKMSLEPIRYVYQPLLLYLIYRLLNLITNCYLYCNGFRKYNYQKSSYWYRYINTDVPPILFLHGISPGFFNYIPFIRRFQRDVPVILFELYPFQIGSLDFSRPTPNEVSNTIDAILKLHGYTQCDIVAHSFGTITTSWFLRRFPSMIRKMVLLDPVSILLGLPDVAHKFLYQSPKSFFHRIIQRFAAREFTIAHSLFRNFDWQENIIWIDEIPSIIKVLVGVSRGDEIIPVEAMLEHLNTYNRKALIFNSLSHFGMVSTSTAAITEIHKQINLLN